MSLEKNEVVEANLETRAGIIEKSILVRDRIIEIQGQHLRLARATRVGKWLMTRQLIPDIDFGLEGGEWDAGDMNVQTRQLMGAVEHKEEGDVITGWVFKLQCPIPEVMVWRGEEDVPIHAWGKYDRSLLKVFQVSVNEAGVLNSSEWFTINPNNGDISCRELARQRSIDQGEDYYDHDPLDKEINEAMFNIYKSTGRLPRDNEFSPGHRERLIQRRDESIARITALYDPDQETGQYLTELLDGAYLELNS